LFFPKDATNSKTQLPENDLEINEQVSIYHHFL